MPRSGLFYFGQADNTEEDYDMRKKKEAMENAYPKPNRPRPEDLGSGAAKKAAQDLQSRKSRLKRLEEENGI